MQVKNWNNQRINSLQEEEILLQLKDEYEKNLMQLNEKISARNSVINSCFQFLSYRKEEAGLIETDSFNRHLNKLYLTPTFDPALGVSTELSTSGKLYLIKDRDLRNLITTWPSYLSQLREEELNIKEWVEARFIPFLIINYQLGSSLKYEWLDDNINSLSTLGKTEQFSLSGLIEEAAHDSILHHPDFEDYLALEMINNQWANRQAISVKRQLDKIIMSIDAQLNK